MCDAASLAGAVVCHAPDARPKVAAPAAGEKLTLPSSTGMVTVCVPDRRVSRRYNRQHQRIVKVCVMCEQIGSATGSGLQAQTGTPQMQQGSKRDSRQ